MQEIVDNCNKRFKATGDACPITIGHTRIGRPEEEQPPICGYAINFRLGRFGPSNKLAILADFYVEPKLWKEFLEHPRRSVEFFAQDAVFDPIAVLKRTPERDLGLIQQYQREKDTRQAIRYAFKAWQTETPVQYSMETQMAGKNITLEGGEGDSKASIKEGHVEQAKKFSADEHEEEKREGEPDTKHVNAHPENAGGPPAEGHEPHKEPVNENEPAPAVAKDESAAHEMPFGHDEEGDLPPDHAYTAERYHKHIMRHPEHGKALEFLYELHKKHMAKSAQPVQYEAGPGAGTGPAYPGANNTALAKHVGSEDDERKTYMKEETANQYAKRVQSLEDEVKSLREANAAQAKKTSEAKARWRTEVLRHEGYKMTERDVERFSKMADSEAMDYMKEIRDTRVRDGAPVGDVPFPVAEFADAEAVQMYQKRSQPEHFSREDRDKAMQIASQDSEYIKTGKWEGAYERAMAAVKAERKPA